MAEQKHKNTKSADEKDKEALQAEINNLAREYAELKEENEKLKTEAAENLDGLQRERASFANFKRRMEMDAGAVYDNSLADHVKFFLPAIDDLERAIKHQPEDPEVRQWSAGIELILQKLLKTLSDHGVTVIAVKPGDEFDPNTQEAITHEEAPGLEDGQVIEAVQTGYRLKDKIIRPTLVRVAK
ncbi:MAG: nucleotide exchange factor GrpE [Anaerolineaceae bacterium]|nr:nucleotide exchange factor GrpE [Anaerolineaceae bacterium]